MQIDVCKFGGSSLANPVRMAEVAKIIQQHLSARPTLVVLSAMQGETARLLKLANELSVLPKGRELDLLLTTGEQAAVALMALHLQSLGVKAIALNAQDIGLQGVGYHQSALVKAIDKSILLDYLNQGYLPVITGFQVVLPSGNLATMERGGSDTTAVALAAAFAANCYIYSDVPGVYSADPMVVKDANHWPEINYSDMLSLSRVGAKVLQLRAIQLAKKYRVDLTLRSTFSQTKQTKILSRGDAVSNFFGLAILQGKHLVKMPASLDLSEILASGVIFTELTLGSEGYHAVVGPEYLELLQSLQAVEVSPLLAKLSLVGLQDKYKPELLAMMLAHLQQADIKAFAYSAHEHGLEFWVDADKASLAANTIHTLSLSNTTA